MKPEILTHPNIPKPLHGIAPREIKGQDWWKETRTKAYQSTQYCCSACGVHVSEAKGQQWLEAHEYWKIDYEKGICEVISIEPLCHYCHNFIHSGRLRMITGKSKSYNETKAILQHGFKILADNKLKCFPPTLDFAYEIGANTYGVEAYEIPDCNIEWSDWKLIFEGEEYHSKFKNYDEWKEYYK